jgi:hypothetical protein
MSGCEVLARSMTGAPDGLTAVPSSRGRSGALGFARLRMGPAMLLSAATLLVARRKCELDRRQQHPMNGRLCRNKLTVPPPTLGRAD